MHGFLSLLLLYSLYFRHDIHGGTNSKLSSRLVVIDHVIPDCDLPPLKIIYIDGDLIKVITTVYLVHFNIWWWLETLDLHFIKVVGRLLIKCNNQLSQRWRSPLLFPSKVIHPFSSIGFEWILKWGIKDCFGSLNIESTLLRFNYGWCSWFQFSHSFMYAYRYAVFSIRISYLQK